MFAEEFEMIMNGASADEVMKVIDDRTYRNFGKKDKQSGTALLGAANEASETPASDDVSENDRTDNSKSE